MGLDEDVEEVEAEIPRPQVGAREFGVGGTTRRPAHLGFGLEEEEERDRARVTGCRRRLLIRRGRR